MNVIVLIQNPRFVQRNSHYLNRTFFDNIQRLTENNPFHLESHYDAIKFGEIKNVKYMSCQREIDRLKSLKKDVDNYS